MIGHQLVRWMLADGLPPYYLGGESKSSFLCGFEYSSLQV
jgi:hypothetical protein